MGLLYLHLRDARVDTVGTTFGCSPDVESYNSRNFQELLVVADTGILHYISANFPLDVVRARRFGNRKFRPGLRVKPKGSTP